MNDQRCPQCNTPLKQDPIHKLCLVCPNPDCDYWCGLHPPSPKVSWGGRRDGAGAPQGNLNAIKHGRDSKLIQTAIDRLAADPELRAFLLLIARAATTGELPQTTRQLILKALPSPKMEAAAARLRRLRDER